MIPEVLVAGAYVRRVVKLVLPQAAGLKPRDEFGVSHFPPPRYLGNISRQPEIRYA